jgi:NAD(P)-dependent dehydrogenase (short-subunit alcohol dehydrogenase family)
MAMVEGQRVAVVTGGGRGIGRGIVAALARQGMALVVNYRADESAARSACALAESLGAPRALAVPADVADLEQGRALLDRTLVVFGRIDYWVNNAGVAPLTRLDLLETTPESWDRVLGINLRGPFFLTQAVAKAMIRLREEGVVSEPGIVFVTSVSSTFATVNRADYCVSKAGLSMTVQLFAARLAELGIPVYEVRPGVIDTDMTGPVREIYDRRIAEGLSPIRRWGTPEDVGRAVAALAAGALPFSTGEVIHVDGGLHLRRL